MKSNKVKLGEVCTVNQGLQVPIAKRLKYPGKNRHFYITVQFLKNNVDNYYIENPPINTICDVDDILMVRTGSTGRVVTGVKGCFHNNFFIVKPKENIQSKYLYYSLNNNYMYRRILSVAGGTTIPDLKHSSFFNLDINLPPLLEQKVIADTLSVIDNKIELNNRINENLEQQAQAIFKNWFIDFEFPDENGNPYKSSGGKMIESELGIIPKGWEVIELNEIVKLTMGLSPKSDTYNFDKIGMPLLNGASDFKDGQIQAIKYTSKPTRICKKNDLVFCIRATIGNITFADKDYCIGRGVASITPKNKRFKGIIYYNLLKSMESLISNASGSVILGLSKPDINNMKLNFPDNVTLNSFSETVNSIFELKDKNESQNKILSQIRDTLLPKLMSGELTIPLE